jgi:hypothetical protein
MAFFGFGKKIQLLLIMGALASAPGCYSSNSGSDDVSAEDPAADQSHDDGIDVFYDQDVVQELMDPDVHIDPPPWPMCTEVETSSLTVFQTAGRFTDHADGNVTLNLPSYYVLSCNLPTPCVSAVGFGEIVPVHFSWRVTCTDTAGAQSEETAGATIYACRDEMSGMLQIVSTYDECIPVVDPPPPPTALNRGGTRIASRIMAGGRIMLSLPQGRDAAKEVIWNASAGSLEILSPLKVLFTPARDQKIQVVQAAVVTPRSVTIELYRYRA